MRLTSQLLEKLSKINFTMSVLLESILRARLEIQSEPTFALASLRIRKKARASCSHASEDSIVASKFFDRRRARLIQPSVLSTTHLFGKTMKPETCLSARLTTVMEMRLVSKAARCASSP